MRASHIILYTIALLASVLAIQSAAAVSGVHHSLDGTKVTISYDGTPPFTINIRGDRDIGSAGGYAWLMVPTRTMTLDLGKMRNPSNTYYYAVKDAQGWSQTYAFSMGDIMEDNGTDGNGSAAYLNTLLVTEDARDEATPGYIDILSASIEESRDNLIIKMRMRDDLATASKDATYLCFLDTDSDPKTGQNHGDFGSEYNIRTHYIPGTGWDANVDVIAGNGGFAVKDFIDKDTLYIVVPKNRLDLRKGAVVAYEAFIDGKSDGITARSIVFNAPTRGAGISMTPSDEIFPGRTKERFVRVSKEKSASFAVNGAKGPVIVQNDAPTMLSVSGNTITDIAAAYHDVKKAGTIGVFDTVTGATGGITALVGDASIGNDVAFILPNDMVPKNEGDPNIIATETLGSMIAKYDYVHVTDSMYDVQRSLVGIVPTAEPQIYTFAYDVCGTAGQPTNLGFGCIERNDNQPQWGVLAHETGHDFTGHIFFSDQWISDTARENSMHFTGMRKFAYSEGFASLNGLYSLYKLNKSATQYGITGDALSSIRGQFVENTQDAQHRVCGATNTPCSLDDYEKKGSPYAQLTPEALTGIFVNIAEDSALNPRGWDAYPRFYRAFLTPDGDVDVTTDAQSATFIVAAMSAATGKDMRPRFKQWNFPIDETYYAKVLPIAQRKAETA